MAGGGGAKKIIINMLLDHPVPVYLGGGALLYVVRKVQTNMAYNWHFGKFDFQRRLQLGEFNNTRRWFSEKEAANFMIFI